MWAAGHPVLSPDFRFLAASQTRDAHTHSSFSASPAKAGFGVSATIPLNIQHHPESLAVPTFLWANRVVPSCHHVCSCYAGDSRRGNSPVRANISAMGDTVVRKLIIYPNDILTTPCRPVTNFDKDLQHLVDDLFSTMYRNDGIGLAAPQIGDGRRVFVMDVRDGKKPFNPMAFINPELLAMTGSADEEEGCLSLPGLALTIRRATYLHFSAQTLDGTHHGAALRGLEARVFQHELDHLQGILLTHRASMEELAAAGIR